MSSDRGEIQPGAWKYANNAAFPGAPAVSSIPACYPEPLASVPRQVHTGRSKAIAAVNQELLTPYRVIGRKLAQRETEQGWGSKAVTGLPTISKLEAKLSSNISA